MSTTKMPSEDVGAPENAGTPEEVMLVAAGPADWRATRATQTRRGQWWERHPRSLRVLTVVALLWGCSYLVWRLVDTRRGTDPVAFVVLVLIEGYTFVSLAFLGFFGWSWSEPERPPATPGYRVDVFVTTYNEEREVVEATLAGCAALHYPHRTYVLDDGRRPEMAALAERWGAHYLTRPDNAHAKAGNINHALGCTDGDLVFCLDADHVPLPDVLDAVVGYFDDERLALVQSPHDFYNQDSVQHYEVGRHEQSMFFEVVCPGKDRHNGVFWCGSAAVIRRRALVGVGGVSTDTIAEDFHSTVKMHRAGWSTRYHDEVLVQGLAPLDLDGYLLQRDRWARGNLAVLRLPESPLSRHAGLSFKQRLSYFASLFAYAAGAFRLLLIGLLIAVLAAGILPARVGLAGLLVLWLPWTVLGVSAADGLCRGHLKLRESSHYTLVTAVIFTRALRCALFPSRTKFKVTPKAGVDVGGWPALRRLWLVAVLGAALSAALIWRLLGLAGLVPMRALPWWAATLACALGVWEIYRIGTSLRIVFRRRQRRAQARFDCLAPASIVDQDGGHAYGRAVDLSISGLGLLVSEAPPIGAALQVDFSLTGLHGETLPVAMAVTVQSVRPGGTDSWRIGAAITDMDPESRDNVVRYCYVVHPTERLRHARLGAGPEITSLSSNGGGPGGGSAPDDEPGEDAELAS